MRKIARDIAALWAARRSASVGNTSVRVKPDGTAVFSLHGNPILRIERSAYASLRVQASLAGWPTATTRSRLRDLLGLLFAAHDKPPSVWRSKGVDYFSGRDEKCGRLTLREWSGEMSRSGWHLVGFLPARRTES